MKYLVVMNSVSTSKLMTGDKLSQRPVEHDRNSELWKCGNEITFQHVKSHIKRVKSNLQIILYNSNLLVLTKILR